MKGTSAESSRLRIHYSEGLFYFRILLRNRCFYTYSGNSSRPSNLAGRTKLKTKTASEPNDSKAVFTGAGSGVPFRCAKRNKSCQKPVSLPFAISPPAKSPLAWGFARFLHLSSPLKTEMHRRCGAFLFQGQEDSNPRPTVLEWLSDCEMQS